MACYHPSRVQVYPKRPDGSPFRIGRPVTVPCGSCLGCRSDQARQWAVRLVHESEWPPRPSWFVTLTYAPEAMPEHGNLDFEDPTRFLKRLRRALPHDDIRYYLCGEYGSYTARPHYHAILYGPAFLDRDHLRDAHDAPVFRSDFLESKWTHGLCELTGLTYGAARYAASYVRKKVLKSDDPEAYERYVPETGEIVELQQEAARMSRRPAIARRWISKYWRDVYPRDFVVIDGQELKPPRYYDRWMDQVHDPDKQRASGETACSDCRVHREVMYNTKVQRLEDAVEIGDEKLIMKEKIHRAKVALFQTRDAI